MNSDDFIGLNSNGSSPRSENDSKKPCLNLSELNYQNGAGNQPTLEESSYQVESKVTLKKVNEHEPPQHKCSLIDGSPLTGAKRARRTSVGQEPSVHIVYNFLTRESKKKLVELLQQWSEWHAQHQPYHNISSKGHLESGEETYFPALHVGSEKPFAVSFWLDSKARKEVEDTQLECDSVPLYDRGYTLGSNGVDASHNSESGVQTLEASRCFNCCSYGHSLKDCPKPRDNAAINSARKQHSSSNSKRNPSCGSGGQVRYYVKTPGKFDDLKAGFLGAETRESLGIGEFDPPPWLHRMREIGYPPAYLDVVEDVPSSGITIFADEEVKEEYEEGELPEKGESIPQEKKMTVEFPGINAPIPENADQRRWATSSTLHSSSTSSRGHSSSRSHHSSDSNRGYHHDLRREYHDDGQPWSERAFTSSYQSYLWSHSPYDNNPLSTTPCLNRSFSDREWRSSLSYETRSPHSPQYSSPSFEKWNSNMSPYDSSPGVLSRHKYDKHEHQRAQSRK